MEKDEQKKKKNDTKNENKLSKWRMMVTKHFCYDLCLIDWLKSLNCKQFMDTMIIFMPIFTIDDWILSFHYFDFNAFMFFFYFDIEIIIQTNASIDFSIENKKIQRNKPDELTVFY